MEENKNNPYQAPTGDLEIKSDEGFCEIKFLSSEIRIGRLRYLSHSFLFTMLSYIALIPGTFLMSADFKIIGGILMGIGYLVLVVLTIIAGIQRLHDLDKSGWFLLLYLVPLVNLILAIYMIFWSGLEGSNKFGKQPPPNKTWNLICGSILPVVFFVGIIAAIALPAYQEYVQRAQGL